MCIGFRNQILKLEWMDGNTICIRHFGRVDRFEIVDSVPDGYVLWLTPRDMFVDPRIIPLCREYKNHIVDRKTLKAYYCKDKETADLVMQAAHDKTEQWKYLIK